MRLPAVRLIMIARWLALAATALMILSAVRFRSGPLTELNQTPDSASAYDFAPGRPRYPLPAPTRAAVRWMIGGGVLLIAALALSRRVAAPPAVSDRPLSSARTRWLLLVIGTSALLLLAESNGDWIGFKPVRGLSSDRQFALLVIGITLVAVGSAGQAPIPRPLSPQSGERGESASPLHQRSAVGRGLRGGAKERVQQVARWIYPYPPFPLWPRPLRREKGGPRPLSNSVGEGIGGEAVLDSRAQQAAPLQTLIPLLLITLIALGLRVWNLNESIHAFVDELNFATAAREFEWIDENKLLQPLTAIVAFPRLYPYGQHFALDLARHDLAGLRLLSALFGALTVPALYLLARMLFDRPTALIAAALLATFPAHLHYSRLGMNNIADPFFGTLALALLAWAMRTQRRAGYALAGVSFGLTQYFYEAGRIVFPVLAVGWIVIGLVIWRRRPPLRGLLITLLAALIVALPVYYTLLSAEQPLAARSNAMIYPADHWRELVNADPGSAAWEDHLRHIKETFLIYVQRHEASFYYAGETPFVLITLVPALLLGGAVALWRIRTPGGLLPLLWITATSLGNSFMVAHQDSPRYVTVFPALALLCALGLRTVWGISFQPTAVSDQQKTKSGVARKTPEDNLITLDLPLSPPPPFPAAQRKGGRVGLCRGAACRAQFLAPLLKTLPLVALVIALCAGQTWYYFGPHLDLFNYQYRRAKLDRDLEDALFRAQEFSPGTQIYLISQVVCNQMYANDLIDFLTTGLDVTTLNPQQLSIDYVWGLPRTVNYAFFIEPEDQDTLDLLTLHFHLDPPAYTTYDIAPDKQFVLYYAPAELANSP